MAHSVHGVAHASAGGHFSALGKKRDFQAGFRLGQPEKVP
jgi:hypothetical protein